MLALQLHHLKSCGCDSLGRTAVGVAARSNPAPNRYDSILDLAPCPLEAHMLDEAQVTTGLQDALDLREGTDRVHDRAEHQSTDRTIKRRVGKGERFGGALDQLDVEPQLACSLP